MSDETELAALERNLKQALEAFKVAEKAESNARNAQCNAQNALNAAQKQIDAYLTKLRIGAPHDSDWGRERMHRVAIKQEAA